jgi:Dyp-type peroxidase family
MAVDSTDIQGNILLPFDVRYSAYLFIQISEHDNFCSFVQEFDRTYPVSTGTQWSVKPDQLWTIAISYSGMSKLRVQGMQFASFPSDFVQGMAVRSQLLGDTGSDAPANWDFGADQSEDVLLSLYADDAAKLDTIKTFVVTNIRGGNIKHQEDGWRDNDSKEHFGFVDGISQPSIAGGPDQNVGGGVFDAQTQSWRRLQPGLFLIGNDTEFGAPRNDDALLKNGTFLVFRKLQQDVPGFRKFLASTTINGLTAEENAAKMMGRWANGTPLSTSPNDDDPLKNEDNLFDYSDDSDGIKCPIGAHIRRTNPRNSSIENAVSIQPTRRRIIRRGVLFGDKLPPGLTADNSQRGLLFIAFMASIEDQFEFIQSDWVNGNQFVNPSPANFDPVVGRNTGQNFIFKDDSGVVRPIFNLKQFVSLKGGGYFFMPSVSLLLRLGLINSHASAKVSS